MSKAKADPLTEQDFRDAEQFIKDNPKCDLAGLTGEMLAFKFRKRRRDWIQYSGIPGCVPRQWNEKFQKQL